MPFTPLHFGPSALVVFLTRQRLDLPVFVLANFAVDLEPYAIGLFGFNLPEHGVCHSLTVGTLIGIVWGFAAWPLKNIWAAWMRTLDLPYRPAFLNIMVSAVLGVWLSVLIDATMYPDINLFYPIPGNPLYGFVDPALNTAVCVLLFIPAYLLYRRQSRRKP